MSNLFPKNTMNILEFCQERISLRGRSQERNTPKRSEVVFFIKRLAPFLKVYSTPFYT